MSRKIAMAIVAFGSVMVFICLSVAICLMRQDRALDAHIFCKRTSQSVSEYERCMAIDEMGK